MLITSCRLQNDQEIGWK